MLNADSSNEWRRTMWRLFWTLLRAPWTGRAGQLGIGSMFNPTAYYAICPEKMQVYDQVNQEILICCSQSPINAAIIGPALGPISKPMPKEPESTLEWLTIHSAVTY